MRKSNQKRILELSLVAAMLLGSSAYAGKIISDADTVEWEEDKQYGFGGWNFSNIDVRIVNVDDFAGNVGTFNSDGSYTPMGEDMSFESDIKDASDVVMGHLHGKDWPVGEPSGIKVINGDMATKHGKPTNCIMTSSYLAYQDMDDNESGSGYLDAVNEGNTPKPVICSSPWQTHKRFKINLLPTTVESVAPGAYGKPVDLIFNLADGDTVPERYQVLQKINNYTGVRLDGYKMEVLDGSGTVNNALTLSLGLGEGIDEDGNLDPTIDIWDTSDMANFSHGLWGPIDDNFEDPGFFDDLRAYYPVTVATNTISYTGDMLGGNYQSLFGNWLPDIWEPTAIFWDDDNDPETDALLMAYWGDPLKTGTLDWHKGKADEWVKPTDTELLQWSTDSRYNEGGVEDVLNLGVNYIINIGDNTLIGSTFILRVTPHVALDQKPPVHIDTSSETPSPIIPIEDLISDGTVAILPTPTFTVGTPLILSVKDADQNTNASVKDTTTVTVTADTGDKETVTLTETEVASSIFTALLATETSAAAPTAGDGKMTVLNGSVVTVTYEDNVHSDTASTTAVIPTADTDTPVDSSGTTASSGGGGCTYNQNSKSFDMMFLLIAALGLLYPFRRKLFAKKA